MFSAVDAAFAGFRVLRSNPMVLAWWAGFHLLFALAMSALMIILAGPQMMALQRMDETGADDPAAVISALSAVGPALAVIVVAYFVYYGVLYAAASRAILRPEERATGYLRLGAAELKQALLIFVLCLLYFVLVIAFTVAAALLIGITATTSGGLGVLVGVLAFLGGVAATLWFGVKFAMASPKTFATGKFSLFDSWSLTKGRFWPMLGAYALATLVTFVISLVSLGVFLGIVFIAAGAGGLGETVNPDLSTVAALFTPWQLAYQVVTAIVTALTMLIFIAPPVDIYRQISGDNRAAAFD